MIIIRLIQTFPPEINQGISPNVYYISKEQVKQGHQVIVFAFAKNKPSKCILAGITVYRIKKPPLIRWFGGLVFALNIKKNKLKPDIIHGLQPITFGWLFPIVKLLIKSKYVLSLHCSIFPLKQGYVVGFKNIIQNYEFSKLCQYLIKRVDFIIPVAKFIGKEIVNSGQLENKIKIISSGINFKLFSQLTKKKKKTYITILYVGRFSQMKNVPCLIEACYILKNNLNFKLLLVGGNRSGNDYKNVIKLINKYNLNNKISIINSVPHENIVKYYQKADIFVLPSAHEPHGKVILEAMASGLPVIATNSGGTSKIIKNNINGILIPLKDPYKISGAIVNIIKNKKLRKIILKNCIKTAQKYDWSIIAKKYTEEFNKIIHQ